MVQIQMYCVIKFCVGAQKMFTKERESKLERLRKDRDNC